MNTLTAARRLGGLLFATILILPLALAGCGGGGGTAPGSTLVTLIGHFQAILRAANETQPVTIPDAQGAAVIELQSDGELRFSVTVGDSWRADVTLAHIHRGAEETDGPIEVALLTTGVADDGTLTVSGTLRIDPALAAEIAASPADFYINVHTNADSGGLVRGQLAVFVPLEWHATLLASNEVPPVPASVDPDERGAATFALAAVDEIRFVIALGTHDLDDLTLAHIHVGEAGVPGPIFVDLTAAADKAVDRGSRTITGTVEIPLETLTRILANLSGFYVNVHTPADAPDGLVRAQLTAGTVEVWAKLSPDDVVPSSAFPSASGGATVAFRSFGEGNAIVAIPPTLGISDIVGAHIHEGIAGTTGPEVIIDLFAGADLNRNSATGTAEGSIAFDQVLLTRIMARPDGFYVDLHTFGAPQGLVRRQLTTNAETFIADLASENEVPPLPMGDTGKLTCIITGASTCSFTLTMNSPPVGDVTAVHVGDGAGGANGPILIDLLGSGDDTTVAPSITGTALFTGRTFARLLAAPQLFHGNVLTPVQPDGAVRGQMVRITDGGPPASLTYSENPALYQTTVPISPNIPSNTGGAVTRYSVTPNLPAGLTLNRVTGIISGTPAQTSPSTDYTITAKNADGSATAVLTIRVDVGRPTSLSYKTPVTYVVGTTITPNRPTSTGGAISSYSVSPSLPAGLSLSTTTGVISGTPTAAKAAANYTVTGRNAGGSVQATVNIAVSLGLQPPSNLSYTTPVTYTTGYTITLNKPSLSGGTPSSFSISPALSTGLSLSTTTGIISGTPTATKAATNYTVTARNAAGSTTATVRITVNLGIPGPLSYSNNPNIGYQNYAIASMSPTHTGGGTVSSYSISSALPTGLTLNTTTGVISGTPTVTSTMKSYTVTATNSAGNRTATITITVY